jgi:Fe-S-cluster-containing dehydrogenase component
MPRYGLVIDVKRCIGCLTCSLACKVENGTGPGVFWNIVKDQEFGEYPNVKRIFLPLQCAHCADPPCVKVCRTGASYKRGDGIVLIDYDKCVGCKYCIEACPYGARCFNENRIGYFGADLTPYEDMVYRKHQVGVAEKCTFCVHKIEKGEQPACVQACVGKARIFGDLDDPGSEISLVIKNKGAKQLKKELGTDPSIFIIPP